MAHRERAYSEDESLADLDRTEVSPRCAKLLSLAFIAVIAAVPLWQLAHGLVRGAVPEAALPAIAARSASLLATDGPGAAWREGRQVLDAAVLRRYEDGVGDGNPGRQLLQPRIQDLLTGWGGFGNHRVAVGRDGWLFYQPGIDLVAGPGLLDEGVRAVRRKRLIDRAGIADPQLDPLAAITAFHRDCAAAGVRLVVVPIPDKASLQPGRLAPAAQPTAGGPPPVNRDWAAFLARLRAAGVDVLDVAPTGLQPGDERFLRTDTHWTPAWMEAVAGQVAEHVRPHLDAASPRTWTAGERRIARQGDLVGMLGLPAGQTRFPPQEVVIHPIATADGAAWQTDPAAPLLLLGDSFTNIYSDGEGADGLGWGRAAGLAPQLALRLRTAVDVIARNGSGASATRAELARRPAPLAGKRVIIWEFAARDLMTESWQVIPIRGGAAPGPAPVAVAATDWIEAELVSPLPTEALKVETYLHASANLLFRAAPGTAGADADGRILVQIPTIIERRLTSAANLRPGQRYRLRLAAAAPAEWNGRNVVDLTGIYDLSPQWAQAVEPR